MTQSTTPPPGSNEALDQGCTCPVLDNNHGRGSYLKNKDGETLFWKTSDCPIHGDGLNLALNDQLAQGAKPDSPVEPNDSNPHSSVG